MAQSLSENKKEKNDNSVKGAATDLLIKLNGQAPAPAPESMVKDKTISLRVNSRVYEQFNAICRLSGTTSNGMLYMLMTQYVADNKDLLN